MLEEANVGAPSPPGGVAWLMPRSRLQAQRKERTKEDVKNPEKELRQQTMVLASWHHHLCVRMIYSQLINSVF